MPQWANQTTTHLPFLMKKNGCLYTILSLKNLRNINTLAKQETLSKYLTLFVILPMFLWVMVPCYMVLKPKYGERIKKYKQVIYLKLAKQRKKLKLQLKSEVKNKVRAVITKRLVITTLCIERMIVKL